MIHYHGTPVSGKRQDAATFLTGRHGLVSFYRPDDMPAVAAYCQSFVLDNGAFSHWRAGKGDIDFYKYKDWVESWCLHPGFDWCLIPDKIDGTEQQNADLVKLWLRCGSPARAVPVWHMHESFDYLNYLVSNFERVALGSSGEWSSPGSRKWWERMRTVMLVACDMKGRPRAKLHGLRMLNPRVFTKLPLSSADSTNAAVNCGNVKRFGMYPAPTAGQRAITIAQRVESHNSAPVWRY